LSPQRPLLFVVVLLLSRAVVADVELQGNLVQGGTAVGQVAPGTRIEIDGRSIRISPDGWFLIGFHRDQEPNMVVRVIHANGDRQEQIINIKARKYDVERIDGLPSAKVSPSAGDLKRIKRENALIGASRLRDSPGTDFLVDFEWPVVGRISGVFGSQRILNGIPKRPHYGVDIAAPDGTPIKAPAPGMVTLVHTDMFYTGGTINLDHGHGLTTIYTHMSEVMVAEGQHVNKGEVIGKVGATGRVTGPHLHWGMNWFKSRLDPALLVGAMPTQ
jgi:murein DD-endopeptidase MepM/ murein hydrolase activator NlpD